MDRFVGTITLFVRPIVLRSSSFSWQATLSDLCFGSLAVVPLSLAYGILVRRCTIALLSSRRRRRNRLGAVGAAISFLTTSLAGCGIVLSPLVFGWPTASSAPVIPLDVFSLRLCCVWLGTFLGERFTPLALSGSIATGKSTVAQQLSSFTGTSTIIGTIFRMVDTDSIGHQILLPPNELATLQSSAVRPTDSVYHKILATFGRGILDETSGHIERRKLGDVIFKDRTLRRRLNAITHPKIIYVMLRQLLAVLYTFRNHRRTIACADVPLLFESGQLRWLFACTIVVACDPEIQLERLRQRNPDLSEEQCRERISSQLPVATKVQQADIVIWNNGDRQSLSRNVERVRKECMTLLYGNGWVHLSNSVVLIGALLLAFNFQYTE